ncbi:MAG: sensor histidine kinase [Brevinematia bacterium]
MYNSKFLSSIVDVLVINERLSDIFQRVFLIFESEVGTKNFVLSEETKIIFATGRKIKDILRNFNYESDLHISETFCAMNLGNYKLYFDFNVLIPREYLNIIFSILKNFLSNYSKFEYIYKRFKYLKSLIFAIEPIIYETSLKYSFSQSLVSLTTFTSINKAAVLSFENKKINIIASIDLDKELLKMFNSEIIRSAKLKKDFYLIKDLGKGQKQIVSIVPLVDLGEVRGFIFSIFDPEKKELDETDKEILKIISFVMTHRLKLHETNLNLIKAKKRAEELSRLKSEFVANVSHELRTPLNAILGFVELLKMGNFSKEEEMKYLDYILSSGINLLSMINNILDLSKIEAGAMKPIFSEIDIDELLDDVRKHSEILAMNKGIEFYLYKSKNLPNKISSDYTMVKSIITNLISNAIKFTDNGWVKVWTYLKDKHLIFRIEDTGIGMKKEDLNKIFETFTQLEGVRNKKHPGTGIGLSLSKKFADMLGAKIIPKTKGVGKGTIFYFALPIR